MLALAGLFALVSALGRPVDFWRISVLSHQGQPLHAVAAIESLPDERISQACLSLGPETDAPGSDAPFLNDARLELNATGTRIEIRTERAIYSPTLALVLRVQCPGEALYARHFNLLIPPAPPVAPATRTVPGFKLKVAEGESVESLVRLLIPSDRKLRQKMVREVLASNPHAFPEGRAVSVAPGTLLFFPDLRILRSLPDRAAPQPAVVAKTAQAPQPRSARPIPAGPAPAEQPPAAVHATKPLDAETLPTPLEAGPATSPPAPSVPASAPTVAKRAAPVRLQTALQLSANPTPQQCSQAMALCGALAAPDLEVRTRNVEENAAALRLRQDSIDQQLIRLEKSLQALQRTMAQTPARTPAPAKPEFRTVVKTEPMPWYYWLGVLGAITAGALGGFVFGRKRAFSQAVVQEDERLDRMLANAAATIREMETSPIRRPLQPRALKTPAVAPSAADLRTPEPTAPSLPGPVDSLHENVATAEQPAGEVDLELESGPTEKPAGLSTDVLFEMDQALDNTRSMFTDVDRFIALGRTQNAISLLQFQVHRDPKDRDSWIKLMAIYRQEKMDVDLAKAAREFKRNFPDENPPVV